MINKINTLRKSLLKYQYLNNKIKSNKTLFFYPDVNICNTTKKRKKRVISPHQFRLTQNVAGGPLSGDRLLPKEYELSAAQLAYLKSPPLNESRLALAPEGEISFYWGNYNPTTGKRERTQIETLPAADFLQRYLQHIPPSGYQTVRHYGLYTSAAKTSYERCTGLLSGRQPPKPLEETNDESPNDNESWISDHTCSVCGEPLIVTKYLPSTRTGQVTSRPPLGPVAIRFPTQRGFHAT